MGRGGGKAKWNFWQRILWCGTAYIYCIYIYCGAVPLQHFAGWFLVLQASDWGSRTGHQWLGLPMCFAEAVTGSAFPKRNTPTFFPVHLGAYHGCYKLLSSMLILFLVYLVCLETDNDEKGTNLRSRSLCCIIWSLCNKYNFAHSVEEIIWNRQKYQAGKF